MDKKLEIDNKKIGKFMKGLTDAEIRYVALCVDFISGLKSLIDKYDLDKEAVVDLFQINTKDYNNYIGGNYNYTIKDIAFLNAAFKKLEHEKS